jgi:drug/metabolite transporter (DMT)-like permease
LSTLSLFAFVVLAWSLNWVGMKVAVQEITPLWAVTIRTGLAALVLFPTLLVMRQLALPPSADLPVLLVLALFQMVGFAALMSAGLIFIPAGRAIVLGYTIPLWVALAAFLFLGERVSLRQGIGVAVGLAGLLLLVGPWGLDRGSGAVLLGHGLTLAAAVCWSVSIVYIRAHRWTTTPLRLMPWQCLLATVVLALLAIFAEGSPPMRMGGPALLGLAYNGIVGTALGFWAMMVVNRRLRATTVSLGLLATPVLGIGFSTVILSEALDPVLILSALGIVAGIVLGANWPERRLPKADAGSAQVCASRR